MTSNAIRSVSMRALRLLACLVLATASLALAASPAWAADPTGVVRGGEDNNLASAAETGNFGAGARPNGGANDFLKDAPIGTVSIDTSSMTLAGGGQFTAIKDGFEAGTTRNAQWVVYTSPLERNNTYDFAGDCFTILFPGIATLQDGSTADVLVTYSNVHLATRTDNAYTQVDPPVGITNGATVGVRNDTVTGQNANGGNVYGQSYAMAIDLNIKVVKDGEPVPGSMLFTTVDLDVGGSAIYKDSADYDNYKEAFEILSGAVSPAYIPEYNACLITGSGDADGNANGVKFARTVGHDPNDFYEGFAVIADSQAGLSLRWTGQGNGMGTTLFAGNISHTIDSTTTKGGSIKTTTSGKLGEGTDLPGPGHINVPDGKDVSYLMEPEEGYELGKITIDGTEIDPDDSTTWPDFIKVTKDSNGNPIVTFKDNAANHKIDVSWNPIVTAKSGKGGSITDPGDSAVPFGADKTYTATPDAGFELGKVIYNGKQIDPSDPATWPKDNEGNNVLDIVKNDDGTYAITLKDVEEPATLEVQWNPIVTATSGAGGKISDPGETGVESGGSKTYTFTPEPGYTIDTVSVDGKEVTPVDNGDGTWSYTLEGITDPTTIDVQWKKAYSISFENGEFGTSTGGNQTGVPSGEHPKGGNSVTPNDGYRFTGQYSYVITDDEGNVIGTGTTDDPTTIEVTGNIVFTPVYQKVVTVTYRDPVTGTVYQTDTIDEGTTEPAAPADPTREGYRFAGWTRSTDEWGNILYEARWTPIEQTPAPSTKTSAPKVAAPKAKTAPPAVKGTPPTGDTSPLAALALLTCAATGLATATRRLA